MEVRYLSGITKLLLMGSINLPKKHFQIHIFVSIWMLLCCHELLKAIRQRGHTFSYLHN